MAGDATGGSTGKAGYGRRSGRRFGSLRAMTELGPVRAAEIAEYDGIGEIVDGLLRGFRDVRMVYNDTAADHHKR